MHDFKPVDINAVIASMIDLLRRALGETIALETVIADGLWHAAIDGARLESALQTLAVKACEAMPQGGILTLETANVQLDEAYAVVQGDVRPGRYVLVSVSDTGAGMMKQVVDEEFPPYFTAKEICHGTGLGLVEVYGFVKQSGGHVKILSEPGAGTTVKLYFPRWTEPAVVPAEAPARPPGVAGTGSGELVLLVEDDADVRAVMSQALTALGYRVAGAADTREALKITAERWDLRVLVTDVGLSGERGGAQLVDAVRVLHPWLPVLFTNGYPQAFLVGEGRLEPGVAFLTKPFTPAQLGAALAKLLR